MTKTINKSVYQTQEEVNASIQEFIDSTTNEKSLLSTLIQEMIKSEDSNTLIALIRSLPSLPPSMVMKLGRNSDYRVRRELALKDYALNVFIEDEDPRVRLVVARKGYDLDRSCRDDDYRVRREVAIRGRHEHLEMFVNDPAEEVRYEVAKHDYKLETLVNDPDGFVASVAKRRLHANA